jgi:hypothetical protein
MKAFRRDLRMGRWRSTTSSVAALAGDRDRMRKWTGMARNLKRTAMRYDAAFIEAVNAALEMRLVEDRSSDA